MSLTKRLLVAISCLGVGLAAQLALQLHLRGSEKGAYPEMKVKLAALPKQFTTPAAQDGGPETAWIGKDNPHLETLRAELPFTPNDLLSRSYWDSTNGMRLDLYAVYSRVGDDRKHHPEVCIRDVLGAPEDVRARRLFFLDAKGERPVQRYRFKTKETSFTTVYYWHYSFEPAPVKGQTALQLIHQRLGHNPPSMTVQISTTASGNILNKVEKAFLPALDAHLRKMHLPEKIRAGCDRLTILLTRQ